MSALDSLGRHRRKRRSRLRGVRHGASEGKDVSDIAGYGSDQEFLRAHSYSDYALIIL
jgi:hypothetical protein